MQLPYSFWFLFSLLDTCYFKCYEDDLGGLLGDLSPSLWSDRRPMDLATVHDWESLCKDFGFCEENAVDCVVRFLESYEKMFGFLFEKTKETIRALTPDEVSEIQKKAYQRFTGAGDNDGAFFGGE